jgi:hypothetical protein
MRLRDVGPRTMAPVAHHLHVAIQRQQRGRVVIGQHAQLQPSGSQEIEVESVHRAAG